jgi:hypothetical protein
MSVTEMHPKSKSTAATDCYATFDDLAADTFAQPEAFWRTTCDVQTVCFVGYTVKGHGVGLVKEIAPNTFVVFPYSLEDTRYLLRWITPPEGHAVSTAIPITSLGEAQGVFKTWAQNTFMENWESPATRAARNIREAMESINDTHGPRLTTRALRNLIDHVIGGLFL